MSGYPLHIHAALFAVQLLFGSWPVVGKLALKSLPGMALVGIRVGGAALLFFALQPRSMRVKLTVAQHKQVAWAGFLGITVNQLLFILGLERTGAVNATVLVTTIPLFTLVFSLLQGTEHATWQRVLGVATAFSGALTVTGASRLALGGDALVGSLMLLGNAAAYALYLIEARKLSMTLSPFSLVPWVFFYGALFAMPFAIPSYVAGPEVVWSNALLLNLAYIILGPTVGTYVLNAVALRQAPPSLVAVWIYAQPVVASLLSFWVLDETPTVGVLAGGLLIFAGVFISTRPDASSPSRETPAAPKPN